MSGKGAHEGRPYVRLGGGRGWVPAGVFTGVGCTREQRRGKAKGEGRKMGPRIREDNGRSVGMVRV